jgi:hypothetical protein
LSIRAPGRSVAVAVGFVVWALALPATNADARPVDVYPLDGTPAASPKTQISVRGAGKGDLSGFRAVGSESGRHKGRFRAHSDRRGVSFLPADPFTPGETVTVRLGRRVAGAKGKRITFAVAQFTGYGDLFSAPSTPPEPTVSEFESEPGLEPPALELLHRGRGASSPNYFISPKLGKSQAGVMVLDDRGELVWFKPTPEGDVPNDLRPQTYRGKRVLTWVEGTLYFGFSLGRGVIVDDRYRVVEMVRAGNGYRVDMHELVLTDRDTALIAAYQPVAWDLSSVGGPADGAVMDNIVQEIDLRTGLVLYEWHSLGNVELEESVTPVRPGLPTYDYFHINSVEEMRNGDLLISGRNTSGVYRIDGRTGNVKWRLGGKRSDFRVPSAGVFAFQHDASAHGNGLYSLFDNTVGFPGAEGTSRGLLFRLDRGRMRVVRSYRTEQRASPTQGNLQMLGNGNAVVGWGGNNQTFTEFSERGKVLFEARFLDGGADSYRAYGGPWKGIPKAPPKLAVEPRVGGLRVHMSWNGATEIRRWRVLGGYSRRDLRALKTVRHRGFETSIKLDGRSKRIAVEALGRSGKTLGASRMVRVVD